MRSPVISIIIPSYNSEETIEKALESVLSQTYRDFEILIIDGASTDRTISIIASYSDRDERVRFVSEKDNGIYDAMNKGINIASGSWLYFMGSDDKLFNNGVLASIFDENDINSYHVIYGNVVSTRFDGVYDGEFNEKKIYNKNICHQAIFLKKELFKITGEFDTSYKGHADWDHNLKWFLNPSIKRKYINIIVADYAEGGYSSMNADYKFAEEKEKNFLRYGSKNIDKDLRTLLYQSIAHKMKTQRNLIGYLKYKIISYLSMYA